MRRGQLPERLRVPTRGQVSQLLSQGQLSRKQWLLLVQLWLWLQQLRLATLLWQLQVRLWGRQQGRWQGQGLGLG